MKAFLKGVKKGMNKFGEDIVRVVNTSIFTLVYFLPIGLTKIVAVLLKKKFLEQNINKESYWSELNLKKKSIEKYYKQF